MFEWNVADGKLMKEARPYRNFDSQYDAFKCEKELSREEKIEFCDRVGDGRLSYMLALKEQYAKDAPSLPKDTYGGVKTVSLKAWLKKHDTREIVDVKYHVGQYSALSFSYDGRFIQNNGKGAYDMYEDLVDEVFHRTLFWCKSKEIEYFNTHDEYSVLMNKAAKCCHFGLHIATGTDGVFLCSKDGYEAGHRRLTLEELKTLISLNEQLEEFKEVLTKQNPISYDNPNGKIKKEKEIFGYEF